MQRSLLLIPMFALVAACGARAPAAGAAAPRAPAGASARADAIRARLPAAPSVSGRRDELALLEESVADPPRPPLENRYYFEAGALFYYTGQQPAAAGSGAEAGARVPLVAEFRGAQALRAVRIEHYGAVPLEPARIEAIRRRAAELASAARDELSAKKVAP